MTIEWDDKPMGVWAYLFPDKVTSSAICCTRWSLFSCRRLQLQTVPFCSSPTPFSGRLVLEIYGDSQGSTIPRLVLNSSPWGATSLAWRHLGLWRQCWFLLQKGPRKTSGRYKKPRRYISIQNPRYANFAQLWCALTVDSLLNLK